ncbi:MAG TPA: hypothetical protein DEP23_05505 [Ruminococcaceae bacterium]|nr:hypothetical protein [Oscillospiraceae bacterium]
MDQPKQTSTIYLSVLVTKEEYSEAEALKKQKLRSHVAPLLNGAAAVFIILGMAGIFFGRYISLSVPAAACFIVLGILFACYDGLIAPVFDKGAAAREFIEKEDLHFATTYVFEDDRVKIQNGRLKGDIPLSMLTRWSETPGLYIMEIGRELSMAIPKRLMSAEVQESLRNMLKKNAPSAKIK